MQTPAFCALVILKLFPIYVVWQGEGSLDVNLWLGMRSGDHPDHEYIHFMLLEYL